MEVVYTRRSGSIRSMPVQSEAERQLNFERQQRAMTEAALDECRAELAAERARVVVAPEPVVELIEPTPPKRLGRPRKAIAETIQTEPEPVRWWAKGSKWDTADE
jgi:hypothetical protein